MPTCCPKEQGAGSPVVPSCAHVCPAGSGTVVPPSSPTRRETPWVAWLGARAHGGKCPCLPAPRKCLLSHERPAAKLYIKARLMATSKQEGRERQTRRLATVGGEKQLALQAGEGLLQPQGETWQMSQMSQMSQKGRGVPAPNAAAGRLSPTAGVGGGQGCCCGSCCPDVLAHCAQQSGFRKPGGDRATQDGDWAWFLLQQWRTSRLCPRLPPPRCLAGGQFPGQGCARVWLIGLGASSPGHPILIPLGGEKSGWDKRQQPAVSGRGPLTPAQAAGTGQRPQTLAATTRVVTATTGSLRVLQHRGPQPAGRRARERVAGTAPLGVSGTSRFSASEQLLSGKVPVFQ